MSKEQLYTQIHNATPVDVGTTNAFGRNPRSYRSNGVTEIKCYDNKKRLVAVHSSPRVELRIKTINHKMYVFFFDTILLDDSRFVGMNVKSEGEWNNVRLADIKSVRLKRGTTQSNYAQEW